MMSNFFKLSSLFFILFFSCEKDNYSSSKKLEEDEEILIEFLKSKRLEGEDIVDIGDSTDTLYNHSNLVNPYRGMYYLILEESVGLSPSNEDIVFINYNGFVLDSQQEFDSENDYRLGLSYTIQGLRSLIVNLKTKDTLGISGKGYVFMSSTKGFGNYENTNTDVKLPKNTNIYYKVELLSIE